MERKNKWWKLESFGSSATVVVGKEEVTPEDFSDGNSILECIDFDDLFVGINVGDVLPDLEVDSEILAEFSGEESEKIASVWVGKVDDHYQYDNARKKEEDKVSGLSCYGLDDSGSKSSRGEEIVSISDESSEMVMKPGIINEESDQGKKSSSHQAKKNNNQGKRKVKVDWTPELHRRFVEAVEQLGMDKAVPSKILELMGIDCLTRHNVASHLQKYRSHRKHLLAREAEAANWTQRRQLYGGATVAGGGGGGKRNVSPWHAPTMGFPPIAVPMQPHFRPLHVWGHPSMDQPMVRNIWPKHLAHFPSRPQLPPDPSYWHHHHHHHQGSYMYYYTPSSPHHARYKFEPANINAAVSQPLPSFDFQPTKDESIDAAIEDVISKPWLPLPLGLKPPAVDTVLLELQHQGIPIIPRPPPTAASTSSSSS